MSPRRHSSLRARIVVAFVVFGTVVGVAFTALHWSRTPGIAEAVGGGLLIAVLGYALGRYTARRVVAPIHHLGDLLETTAADQQADALATATYDREVAALAERLEDALRRQADLGRREQRFMRYASHELRTPVAVARGAVEILDSLPAATAPEVRRPLDRLRRSVADMENIIEAFLWLGRSDAGHREHHDTDVATVVEGTVARYSHLVDGKPVRVDVKVDGHPQVDAPPAVVDVVAGNLIANAFNHTDAGQVTVSIEPHSLTIADTGTGITGEVDACARSFVRGDASTGFGLGLSIVKTLSERLGWRFWLDSDPTGTIARVYF